MLEVLLLKNIPGHICWLLPQLLHLILGPLVLRRVVPLLAVHLERVVVVALARALHAHELSTPIPELPGHRRVLVLLHERLDSPLLTFYPH